MNSPNDNRLAGITATHGLAAIGFVALVIAGIWLAVSATRFVPGVANRVGSAAVYLGSIFVPAPSTLSVVPPAETATTTIFFGNATPTVTTVVPPAPVVIVPPRPISTTAGTRTNNTYQIGTTTSNGALYGLPDLIVNIVGVGYLLGAGSDSFVIATTVPSGNRPAVRFTIKNVGTNATGAWRFSATIPTQSSYFFQSAPQQSLAPGESIDYTLGFDQATKGSGKMISITANFDNAVKESNSNNNSAAGYLTILGS